MIIPSLFVGGKNNERNRIGLTRISILYHIDFIEEESNTEEWRIELKKQKDEIKEESNMEEWKIELKKQKDEIEEEVGPIIKLSDEGKLTYDEYLEKLLQALERAKEKYCRRHGITKEEYDREERYEIEDE